MHANYTEIRLEVNQFGGNRDNLITHTLLTWLSSECACVRVRVYACVRAFIKRLYKRVLYLFRKKLYILLYNVRSLILILIKNHCIPCRKEPCLPHILFQRVHRI